jgi:histidine triad (HIT) family protein
MVASFERQPGGHHRGDEEQVGADEARSRRPGGAEAAGPARDSGAVRGRPSIAAVSAPGGAGFSAAYDPLVPSLFTRIIDGELPGTFVWRDERCVAFLSINPVRDGHVLVVPRAEVDHWVDLEPELTRHLITVAQVIARAQQQAFTQERIGLLIAGLEVPHTHLHLIPMASESDLHLANAKASVSPEELERNASAIRAALVEQGAAGVSRE